MKIRARYFHRILRSMETHLADRAEQREASAIAARMAEISASLGKPSKRRHSHAEPMPHRHSIAAAFVALAAALAGLSWWCP